MKMRNWPLDDLLLVAKHKLFHSDITSYVMIGDKPVYISNYGLTPMQTMVFNINKAFAEIGIIFKNITPVFEDFGKKLSEAMNPLLAQEDVVD